MRPSTMQIVIVILIIVLLFGAKRLPDLAKGVGQSLKVFKNEVKDLQNDDEDKLKTNSGDSQNPDDTAK